tara:strand:+ start:3214 stop:3594 length:381 start_codon:yes stop_codon:yes gene_type:complete
MALNKTYAWYISRNKIAIVEKDNSNKWKSITSTGKTIRVFCSKKADNLTSANMDSIPGSTEHGQIPSQFHEGLVSKAISFGYKDPRNLNIDLAAFFEKEYQETEKRAKKWARMNHSNSGKIVPVDF